MRHFSRKMGFTMVELLVVLGIFSVMTGVVLGNYRTYNTNALFSNASEDIVLALRQAQVYGAGVKGQGGSFDVPYGAHFVPGANNIVLFGDVFPPGTPDGKYTAGSDTLIDTIMWQDGIKINNITCNGGLCTSFLDITFRRPNVGAIIGDSAGSGYSAGQIIISNGVKYSTTTISKAGQISLQ